MDEIIAPDICVIGAGAGGLTVAAAAAAFGVSVVLIEKGRMGGDCLNYGCVPSKAMVAAGKHAHWIGEARKFGVVSAAEPTISRRAVINHVRSVIAAIEPNDTEERFASLGVRVIREHARFSDRGTVDVGNRRIRARRFVIATGSSPVVPPIPGLGDTGFLTNETVFELGRKPAHLIVIGGGPVGMELAQAHHRLGSRVSVLEGLTALNREDPELADVVVEQLRREGVEIHERTNVVRVEKRGGSGVRAIVEDADGQRAIDGSHILVAAGRKPNTDELGLDAAGIRHDASGIKVDSRLRTTNRRVFAIGDVAGDLQFTHVAGYHAASVIRSILFRFGGRVDHSAIPRVTFTEPELAHVGMSEEAARGSYRNIRILRWPYHENDRAHAERRTRGHIKIITTKRGRILGATIAGAAAGEMIHLWTLAISRTMSLRDLMGYVPPYPTYSEIGRRAAISFYAPMAGSPWVRRLIGVMRRFG